jgi:hypothetical protein
MPSKHKKKQNKDEAEEEDTVVIYAGDSEELPEAEAKPDVPDDIGLAEYIEDDYDPG